MKKGRYIIDEILSNQGPIINIVSKEKEVCANLRREFPCNVPNLITNEQVSIPHDPKVYKMIDQLKNTPTEISLYDLISTSQVHRDILYDLFMNETIPNNILAAMFSEKIRTIKECDAISFYKYGKLNQELLYECFTLYITPMVDGWEVKCTIVDNGSTVNVCSNHFLMQLQEKGLDIPPLEEDTFRIRAYDSSLKKPLGITTIMITIGIKTIAIKFHVVESKLSYNMLLGRPWIHDMDAVPSTLHSRLKFEFQGEVHIVMGDPKAYALCNVANLEEFSMLPSRYEIESLEFPTQKANNET